MLKEVSIANFKSIGPSAISLKLKPLTIVVGPNGGGKSAILEAIIVWALHMGADINPSIAPSLPSFQRSFEQLVHQRRIDNEICIEIVLDTGDRWMNVLSKRGIENFLIKEGKKTQASLPNSLRERIFFLSAFRGRVEFEAGVGSQVAWVGPTGEHVITILNYLKDPDYEGKEKVLTEWAAKLGVKNLWSGVRQGSGGLTSLYQDFGVRLQLAVASHGSRQVMPILVNLVWSSPESIHLIEEPEISLHPEHQVRILEFFAHMIREGKKIIATTHSHFLISALGIPVQQGLINAEDIAVYHVEKTEESGTVVQLLPLTEEGYIDGGVPSFAGVEDRLVREWVKTLKEQ